MPKAHILCGFARKRSESSRVSSKEGCGRAVFCGLFCKNQLFSLKFIDLIFQCTNDPPIYVYQFFCFALVLVGAWLQYSSTEGSRGQSAELNAALERAAQAEEKLTQAVVIMHTIVDAIPNSIQDLKPVNNILTGNVCSGGTSGVPIAEGIGTRTAAISTNVIARLAAAKSSIESAFP